MPLTKEERRIRNTVGRIEDIPTVAPAPIPLNQDKAASKAIEKITKLTGIKSLAQMSARAMGKKDCGCNKRKEALNKAFPYKK